MIIPADSIDLKQYSVQELVSLKDKIEGMLPTMQSLDLQQELVLQFASAKALFGEVQEDRDTPLNQKAQIINSAASLLKQLADAQIKLYSAERNRALELTLIGLLKEADAEDRAAFMEEYEKRLGALGE